MALSDRQRELLKAVLREKGLAREGGTASIPRRAAPETAPATPLQEGLWLLEQLGQQEGVNHVPGTARFAGPLDVPALERALDEIVRRHDVLRSVFSLEGTELRQRVQPHRALRLEVVDLSDADAAAREDRARELVDEAVRRPFALDREVPFRALLVRLSGAAEEHVLALVIHHIATDGYSMGVFTRELASLYGAFSQGQPSPLPELPIQFGDYAAWQREWLAGAELERQRAFWRDALRAPLATLELPADRPRPERLSGRGLHEHVHLPRDLTARIRSFSRRHGVTVFETLLAGFAALLHGYSAQEDVVVGSPVANRTRIELESLIGYFVNVLPFRIDLRGDPTFPELVERVQRVSQGVHAHQEMAFSRIVELVNPPRDPSRNPIYQVEFTLLEPGKTPSVYGYGFRTIAQQSLALGPVALSPFPVESGVSKFDLTMLLWNLRDEIQGTIEYSTDLFESRTIQSMAKRFVSLLERALSGTGFRVGDARAAPERPPGAKKRVGAVKRTAIRAPK